MSQTEYEIEEKTLDPVLIAGLRVKCRYDEVGPNYKKLGRSVGRYISGKAMCLYYDAEYQEGDADLEPCMPIRKQIESDEFSIRELPGGRCVSLIHQGPWEELGRSYERIRKYVDEKGYQVQLPTREVYLKGPGMIFRGNPEKYVTEIQVMLK